MLTSKLAAVLVACTALVACAATPPNPREQEASQAEKDAARDAMIACAHKAIPAMDDGISSADVIGCTAAAQCNNETRLVLATLIQGMDGAYAQGFISTWDPPSFFTGFVLTERARHRAHSG